MQRRALKLSIVPAFAVLAALHTPPAAAQNVPDSIRQAEIRPGVLGPGVAGIAADGQVVPGGDIEAQTTGPDGNVTMRLVQVRPFAMSGGSGMAAENGATSIALRPYWIAVPFDPSRSPSQR
jgi:hypothetical protein